jgi:hypothetical protein
LDGEAGSEVAAPYGSNAASAADRAAGWKAVPIPADGCAPHGVGEEAPEAPPAPSEPAVLPAFLQKLIAGLDQADPFDPDAHATSADSRDPQTGAHPMGSDERVRIRFGAPRDVARLFRAALATVQRRIERKTGRPSSQGEAPDGLRFSLGLRRGYPPLFLYEAGDRVVA